MPLRFSPQLMMAGTVQVAIRFVKRAFGHNAFPEGCHRLLRRVSQEPAVLDFLDAAGVVVVSIYEVLNAIAVRATPREPWPAPGRLKTA